MLEQKIIEKEPNYSKILNRGYSKSALDLVKKLLNKSVNRMRMVSAMKHDWWKVLIDTPVNMCGEMFKTKSSAKKSIRSSK